MKYILTLVVLLFAHQLFAQLQNKTQQIIPPLNLGGRWDDFCMVNDSVGFVVTQNGYVYKTTNAFQSIAYKAGIGGYGRSVAFLNDSIGFVGNINFSNSGSLYQTTDGGNTWTDETRDLLANDTIFPPRTYGVCGLSEAGNTIYACGAYSGLPFVAKYNGIGNPWSYVELNTVATGLVDMHWVNETTGFVTGSAANVSEGGIILYTQDGGQTWTRVFESGTPMDIVWKLFPLNDSIIYAAIQSYAPHSGRIAKSTDGGMSWAQLVVDTTSVSLQGVGFVNEMEGYVGGHFEGYYATSDGGLSWNFVNDFTIGRFNRFLRVKHELMVSGSSIYAVIDSNYVGIQTPSQVAMEATLKVHPNPTSGIFTLQIDLPQNTNGHLLVYDLGGKILAKVPHQPWEPGQHLQQFDSSQYPAGTYYVGFITDHGNWFAPVVVSR